jgi:LEA14-like dessication related protein
LTAAPAPTPPALPTRRSVLAGLPAALVAGCTSLGDARVEVHLASVMLLDATLPERRIRLTLRLQNRGVTDLTVDGLAYRIEASGTIIASGVNSQTFTIPRFGEARLDVEATGTQAGIVRQVLELQRQTGVQDPRLRYRIYGTANLVPQPMTIGRAGSFSFDTVNELPLPGMPAPPPR